MGCRYLQLSWYKIDTFVGHREKASKMCLRSHAQEEERRVLWILTGLLAGKWGLLREVTSRLSLMGHQIR